MSHLLLLKEIVDNPIHSISRIFNLVLIEAILSIDNAAILTTMVSHLNKEDRKKALKYGIIGASIFRIISLFFASVIMKMWFFKIIGGSYLIYLGINHFLSKKRTFMFLNKNFKVWKTIIYIEIIDILFSIDNILGVLSYSNNTLLIVLGIFISLFLIRISTIKILRFKKIYSSLEESAFIIIILLGLKLIISIYEILYPDDYFTTFLQSQIFNISFSLISLSIFILPIIYLKLLNNYI
ncbi:Membrane protein TerC, possibly involved in tellurium resistance [Candidatus Karelsulcia muelleri DMIN]|uniref:Membrane protein TerC, possibly involved in tellurium resistance n=1 Tax=Karelsulcia muelleri (strain DMIN) TaxID=641892 RepID=D5D907_KARMD|nr:Membrane protein TerC, possibly involved in tellurium resistance [Candidatus Karelsulcia muelleri DMIN]